MLVRHILLFVLFYGEYLGHYSVHGDIFYLNVIAEIPRSMDFCVGNYSE